MPLVDYVCENSKCVCKDHECNCKPDPDDVKDLPCTCQFMPCSCKEYECTCKEGPCTCEDICDYVYEAWFTTTEPQPDVLTNKVCEKCGGNLVRGLNLKSNSQVWGVNKI